MYSMTAVDTCPGLFAWDGGVHPPLCGLALPGSHAVAEGVGVDGDGIGAADWRRTSTSSGPMCPTGWRVVARG